MKLTAKESIFVKEYLVDRNGTRAALAAGYGAKSKGKKAAKIAGVQATRMLVKPSIKAAIEAGTEKHLKKADLTAQMVLDEIRKLAFVNTTEAFNPDGTMKALTDLPEDVQAAMASLEVDEIFAGRGKNRVKVGHTRKFKAFDKVRSLEMLAKYYKLLTDVQEHRGAGGGPLVILTMPANGSEAPKPVKTENDSGKDQASLPGKDGKDPVKTG